MAFPPMEPLSLPNPRGPGLASGLAVPDKLGVCCAGGSHFPQRTIKTRRSGTGRETRPQTTAAPPATVLARALIGADVSQESSSTERRTKRWRRSGPEMLMARKLCRRSDPASFDVIKSSAPYRTRPLRPTGVSGSAGEPRPWPRLGISSTSTTSGHDGRCRRTCGSGGTARRSWATSTPKNATPFSGPGGSSATKPADARWTLGTDTGGVGRHAVSARSTLDFPS